MLDRDMRVTGPPADSVGLHQSVPYRSIPSLPSLLASRSARQVLDLCVAWNKHHDYGDHSGDAWHPVSSTFA